MKKFIKNAAIILLIALAGCSSGGFLLDKPITMDQEVLAPGAKGLTYEFSATEPIEEEIAIIQKDNKIINELKAFTSALNVTSPQDYKIFKEIEDSGRCPASFLNNSSFLYLIVTDKISVANKLKSCKQGDIFTIKGYYLDIYMSKGEMDLGPMNKSGNIYYIYIDNISKK